MEDLPPRSDSAFEVRGVEAHAHDGSKLNRADEMDRIVDVRGGWLTTRSESLKIRMESSKAGTGASWKTLDNASLSSNMSMDMFCSSGSAVAEWLR